MADVRLVLNQRAIAALASSPTARRAIDTAAQGVRDRAVRLAPRVTGRLAASISYAVRDDEQGVYADIYEDSPYGARVELGLGQPARPYLRPALSG